MDRVGLANNMPACCLKMIDIHESPQFITEWI
jgi:hypothetical protein